MKTNYKKMLKFATLLITSALIATVSAQIYSYMYIEGSGSIISQKLSWQLGESSPSGATIQGAYVKNFNLSVPANTPRTFNDSLRIVNNDINKGYTFSLEVTSVGGNPGNFSKFDLVLYNSTGDTLATLDIRQAGNKVSNLYIGPSATLYIRFEVVPVTDKTEGYFYFTVKLTYEE